MIRTFGRGWGYPKFMNVFISLIQICPGWVILTVQLLSANVILVNIFEGVNRRSYDGWNLL